MKGPTARPAGLARGVSAFAATWFGAAMIAVLTGATGVVILLAVGVVAGIAGAMSGRLAMRGARVHEVKTATVATAGDDLGWTVRADVPRPVHAVVCIGDAEVARGWLGDGSTLLVGHAPRRGIHDAVTVTWSTAGRMGMLWWKRRTIVPIQPLFSGPVPAADPAPARRADAEHDGTVTASVRSGHDDVDGVRQWRDGDEVTAVHWPSTIRLGEFVVRQRQREQDERWVVTARTATGDPDREAARVRRALDDCMSRGAATAVRVDDGEPIDLPSAEAVVKWCAAFEPIAAQGTRPSWWRRELTPRQGPEPDTTLEPAARWAVAAASLAPLAMLLQPLGYGPAQMVVVLAAVIAGAFVTSRRRLAPAWLRQSLGVLAGAIVAFTLVDSGSITGVMTAMRYLMPQLLVALCIVQGFECVDRRGARVSLACSALLVAYAAGVRVDGSLGTYMLAAGAVLAVGTAAITSPDRRHRVATALGADRTAESGRSRTRHGATLGAAAGAVAVVALLAVVPVPKGPAQLNLPSFLSERRPTQLEGELATITGSPLLGGPIQGDGSRSGAGAGGYPGFSQSMNTSLRGDLGNDVVLRVRAPSPDFWRGQTFLRFDGTTWFVEDVSSAQRSQGPDHRIPRGDGDLAFAGEPEFIQTFYVEVDMPNIVFAATRAMRVLLDAGVWARPDGALRADVVLPAGSAYTVVSHRTDATAHGLRADGDLAASLVPEQYLQIPDSTTARTRALAARLRSDVSTYDTVLAIQAWLAANTSYDLDAPVPPDGADAVDHFLFESQLGFCEQIASATAIMLRTLGIPARIATGYVPSERDEIAGVWISRARDAHAWVEVWFPSYGWVAFDPTASVPLAGESVTSTIGGDLVRAVVALVGERLGEIVLLTAAGGIVLVAVRAIRAWWRRHRRGRWGVLQDRFVAAAIARGASPNAPNADLAAAFDHPDAHEVARTLDESAFAPGWSDDDGRFERVAGAVAVLERRAP